MNKIFIYIFLFTSFSFIFYSNKVEAASGDIPFGGKSSSVVLCSCSFSFMITINNLAHNSSTENFIYNPISTVLYPYFLFISPDVWMTGIAETLTAECMQVTPNGCSSIGSGYPMKILGTSI